MMQRPATRDRVLVHLAAALYAVGCMLPEQLLEQNYYAESGIDSCLGPGYFVWCAAPILLAVAAFRASRFEPRRRFGLFTWLDPKCRMIS